MGRHQDDEQAPDSVSAQRAARRSHDLLESASAAGVSGGFGEPHHCARGVGGQPARRGGEGVAAVVTGSASLVAEAAHSLADAGNEVFLSREPAVAPAR